MPNTRTDKVALTTQIWTLTEERDRYKMVVEHIAQMPLRDLDDAVGNCTIAIELCQEALRGQ